ncbi:MAG: hypothetical protein IKN46_03445, partial [Acholeplasmatales bacterium]|nr:hypothetical protein [Acholeplasmatales bacterium]
MKYVRKIRCSGISILLLLVAVFSSNGVTEVNENNIQAHLKSDCESVSSFIEDNFMTFINEYNNATNEKWLATSIELKKPVINVTNNTNAVYLDFDGDN